MFDQLANEMFLVLPLLCLAVGALVVMMLDVFSGSATLKGVVTAVVLGASIWMLCLVPSYPEKVILGGLVFGGSYTYFTALVLCLSAFLTVLLALNKQKKEGPKREGEYYTLLLMAVAGGYIFISAAELITLFIGLEILSLALYALCASELTNRSSVQAGVKYFMLGSFASVILLYGMALLYGASGSTEIIKIADVAGNSSGIFLSGAALLFCGMLFKIGLVPFHFWVPDVYHGAPTAVSAFMASGVKAAAVAVMLRILWVLFGSYAELWMDLVWWVAALSILLGNFVALSQRGLKSLLAYSSIAHAGYIAMGILARSEIGGGGEAALYYLLIYSFMTLGAFGVVLVLSAAYADKRTPDDITRFNGLATTHPWTAALMTFFMLALAGMPPAMGGFMAKFFVFTAAIKSGHVGIVLIACLGALVGAYYYLRVVVAMYFAPSAKEPRRLERDPSAYAVLALCAAAILVLGVFPQVVYVRAALAVSGM